jgi:hypothetical protein
VAEVAAVDEAVVAAVVGEVLGVVPGVVVEPVVPVAGAAVCVEAGGAE